MTRIEAYDVIRQKEGIYIFVTKYVGMSIRLFVLDVFFP